MGEEAVGTRNGFSNLLKEKVIVQQIWSGININNSWERLLIKAPHSLAALEKLVVQAVTQSTGGEGSTADGSRRRHTLSRMVSNDLSISSQSSLPLRGTLSKMMSLEIDSGNARSIISRKSSIESYGAGGRVTERGRLPSNSSSRCNSNLQLASVDGTQKDGVESASTITNSSSIKNRIINAMAEARTAMDGAHRAMALIGKKTNEIPRVIGSVLSLVEQLGSQPPDKVRDELNRLHAVIDECAQEAFSLEDLFQTAIEMADSKSTKLGRSGFMLMGEVKHMWEKVVLFCGEISKLIEYTLDSSCNAFIAIILEQVESASVRSKYRLKDRARQEIYQISLACVAYALSVRHLTDAYSAFSSEFMMPQVEAIARYPLIANSEIELAKSHEQFKELNNACNKEIDRVVRTNRATAKRRSILELDFGLDLHLSDISADLDEFLTPIAEFKLHGDKKTGADDGKPSSVFERFRMNFSKKAAL